jgi:hypothetical protein
MTWFRKTKHAPQPQKCRRYGEGVGVVCLTRLATPEHPAQEMWLCGECAKALRNEPRDS